jgi:hypothetical protein
VAEVFAGFICGYGLALVVTPLGAIALLRARMTSPLLRQVLPEGTSLIALSVILHVFAFLTLTALGILLGLLLAGLNDRGPDGGLGSPNGAFTGFILITAAIAVGPLALFAPRLRRPLLVGGLVFVGVFGWLMPYLALWGPDGG